MKYWMNMAQSVGLDQAVLEYVATFGDIDETILCDVFKVSKQEARKVLENITIDNS